MTYYLAENGSSVREFNNLEDFINTIKELADMCATKGDVWFEVEIARD